MVAGRSLLGAVIGHGRDAGLRLSLCVPDGADAVLGAPQDPAHRAVPAVLHRPGGARLWLADHPRQRGAAERALGLVGVGPFRLIYNYPAVLFGLVQYMLPFAVLMLAPALTAIPEEIERAAESLGANRFRTFRHVVLPMARPGLIGAGIVVFTLSLTDFAMPAILGGGTNDFIANAIYDQFFRTSDQGLGATLTMLLVVLGSALVGIVFALRHRHARPDRRARMMQRSKSVVLWTFVIFSLITLSRRRVIVRRVLHRGQDHRLPARRAVAQVVRGDRAGDRLALAFLRSL